jgi:hypothetical protein
MVWATGVGAKGVSASVVASDHIAGKGLAPIARGRCQGLALKRRKDRPKLNLAGQFVNFVTLSLLHTSLLK